MFRLPTDVNKGSARTLGAFVDNKNTTSIVEVRFLLLLAADTIQLVLLYKYSAI